jgi:hypothetical protein
MVKQAESYSKVKEDTIIAVTTYKDFEEQITQAQNTYEKEKRGAKTKMTNTIAKLKVDMKFFAKQIKENNKFLKAHNLEEIHFEAPKKTKVVEQV